MTPPGLRHVPSLPGVHVSEIGRVWVDPWVTRDGKNIRGQWKTPYMRGDGYCVVTIYSEAHLLHRLIAEAHIPNPEGLPVVRHRDDDPSHNEVSNLLWGTHADNTQDMISRGRAHFQQLTHCSKGHDIKDRDAGGNCKGCTASRRSKGLPQGDKRHGTSNGFSNYGCRCPECREAESSRGKEKYERLKGNR